MLLWKYQASVSINSSSTFLKRLAHSPILRSACMTDLEEEKPFREVC